MTIGRAPSILCVLHAGPGVTLQDSGRHGFLRYGVTPAGPMDALAHATANLAVGNPPGAPAIEISIGGVDLTSENGPLSVALAGGEFNVGLDDRPLAPAVSLTLEPGAVLRIRAGRAGNWCYLAARGRLDIPPVLGSLATHSRSSLGGINGRALATGNRLRILGGPMPGEPTKIIAAPWLDRSAGIIRVVLGPQDDYFAPDQIAAFLSGPWLVSARSDRMACFLDGPALEHCRGYNIVSDGIAMGAIQVPGDGCPVVLMADRQPTGGYPKIATVIGPDVGRLAQARPGTAIRFQAVSLAEAVTARRSEAALLARPIPFAPMIRTEFSPEFLLCVNLIDGVFAAAAGE
jgi:biotin-dependent carboxylase-like uncharacterized protein